MKRFLALVLLSVLALLPAARADGPDDQYVGIYSLIQQGDALNQKGQLAPAMAKYVEAQSALKKFQGGYPDWNPKVVKFRLKYVAAKIDELSSKAPPAASTNAPPAAPASAPAGGETNPAPAAPVPGAAQSANPPATNAAPPLSSDNGADAQIKALSEQIRHLEADKVLLEAKLKEALSAQPTAVDPRELAKVEDKIKELQKENDLLKVSLAEVKTNAVAANPAALEQARQALAEANRKAAQLTEANTALTLEKEALQARVKTVAPADDTTSALRAENEILKKQVAGLQARGGAASGSGDLNRQLLEAQSRIAALQSDKDILRLEKIALENRVKQMSPAGTAASPLTAPAVSPAVSPAPATDSVSADKIRQLEAQRDELQKSLLAATKDIYGRKKGKETAERIDEMTRQLAGLRARIENLEAQPVPYTPEELALFGKPGVSLMASAHAASRKQKELSPDAAMLVAEAKRYYAAGQFEQAEEKYQQVLKTDEKNVSTLAHLASIQIERDRALEAEKNLTAALALDPNDEFSLLVMGDLRFRQKKYDEALEVLSRGAQVNPQNPGFQNYLGITLSQKGLRGPAEAALRKAVQLDPNYGEAHYNLAVVYITQNPPLAELARWHYQKAMAAGHPHNADLERMLDSTKAAAAGSR